MSIGKDERFAFKRALSRLLEMTCERYIAEEHWNSLPLSSRRWERSTSTHNATDDHKTLQDPTDRSAAFVTNERPHAQTDDSRLFVGRPDAPKLSEDHMWGIRGDWKRGSNR